MTRRGWPLLLAAVLSLAGCGVPAGGPAEAIPSSEVPYGLAAPRASAPPTATAEPVAAPSEIYLVGADEALVARPREVAGSTTRERLADLLSALQEGPTTEERDRQLSTLLPPEAELTVSDLARRTATIDLDLPSGAPSAGTGRRAVAQVVLTATSLPGVEQVRLTLDGEPVEAPLPSGQLTSAPLTAQDYAVLLTAPEPPAAVPAEPS
ncbi:UNVERIFIED_ORG: hypothetical protein E4P37_13545 [Bacillus sp. AZ43]